MTNLGYAPSQVKQNYHWNFFHVMDSKTWTSRSFISREYLTKSSMRIPPSPSLQQLLKVWVLIVEVDLEKSAHVDLLWCMHRLQYFPLASKFG